MIADLKPYADYKESGLPWLGQVPGHWNVVPSKALFRHRKEKARTDDKLLTASQAHGIIDRDEFMATEGRRVMHVVTGYDILKHVEPNDFVMSMRSFQGGLEWSKTRGAISSAYVMLIPQVSVHPPYFARLLKCAPYISALRQTSDLVRDGQALRYANFGQVPLPSVPPDEQAAIVRFLDWANGRLERAIRAKRKVIALLGEQKQAIIHRAVTRGLDPSVPLKPSGIPWLGDIPQHWEVVALGRTCTARCDGPFGSGLKSAHYSESGVRVIRLQNIGSGEFRSRDGAFISSEHYATLGDHGVVEGDLLVAGLGDEKIPAGRACVAPPALGPAMVKADCFRFRLKDGRVVAQFLALHLSATASAATACLSTGATRLRINLSATAARAVAVPPMPEQQAILVSIAGATAPLITAISRLNREIELLREYRTRLVADVVTGKLDVREAALHLPDETLPETVADDADLGDEAEAADEEAAV